MHHNGAACITTARHALQGRGMHGQSNRLGNRERRVSALNKRSG
jgi:hypothetical protein